MPQMAPYNWLYLNLMFMLIFYMYITYMNFINYKIKFFPLEGKKKIKIFYIKW